MLYISFLWFFFFFLITGSWAYLLISLTYFTHPLPPQAPLERTCLFPVSVSLFLFCRFVYFLDVSRVKAYSKCLSVADLSCKWARCRRLRRGLGEALLLELKGEEGKHEACEGLAPSTDKTQVTRGWNGRKTFSGLQEGSGSFPGEGNDYPIQ